MFDKTDDLEVMARTIYGEAKARNKDDATAIAHVIMNRVRYKNWPNTPSKVCLQRLQFSCWNENDSNKERIETATKSNKWFKECLVIASDVMYGRPFDPTLTATHYHTRAVAPKWSKGKTPCYETDGHLFFNDIDTVKPARRIAQVATGGAIAATIADNITTISPAFPVLSAWVQYAPFAFSFVAIAGVAYLIYDKVKNK